MNVTKEIDYIQFSTPKMVTMFEDYPQESRSPNSFYKRAKVYAGGLMVLTGNPNTDKELVIMSGKTCRFYRSTLDAMLEDEMRNGAKVSRLDLCVNVDSADHLNMFDRALTEGIIETKRFDLEESIKILDRQNNVETLYVGNLKHRAKKGIFRAYDKAKEQGLQIEWSRFELETRGQVANNNAKRYLQGVDIGNMINNTLNIPQSWWSDLMGAKSTLEQTEMIVEDTNMSPEESRWIWLMKQVAPALGKAIAHDQYSEHNGGNFERFQQMVQKHYEIERAQIIQQMMRNQGE